MRRKILFGLVALAVLPALAGGLAWRASLGEGISRLGGAAQGQLAAAATRLDGQIARYRQLPRVLAEAAPLAEAVAGDLAFRARMNALLERIADATGALDIYLMDTEGTTVAASNWASEQTFIGRNFAFRPYFQRAMDGGLGAYYALGTTSRLRGWYFAGPLHLDGRRIGVVAVKADVDVVEEAWREDGGMVFFTDPHGVVFVSNRREAVFRALGPLDTPRAARIDDASRYLGRHVDALPRIEPAAVWDGGALGVMRLDSPGWAQIAPGFTRAVMAEAPQARLDMTGHVLLDAGPAITAARNAGLAAGAGVFAAGVLGLLVLQRGDAARRRRAEAARIMAELETRVIARTRDLTAANAALEGEIAERRAAEAALRRAQDDLVQAAKLSALGQMSAGISHELNQPLAAIRNFADNAGVYLERGRLPEVGANLGRISDLTARMDRIIRNLRAFARKEGEPAADVALDRVAADALALMAVRVDAARARVDWTPPEAPVMVRGGAIRLQQVAMNLIGNALDAMGETPEDQRILTVEVLPGSPTRLVISDCGPGLAEDAKGRLFDPFFTTKPVGEGTGLGLSISYGIVQSFGGRIRGETRPEGGATFTVELQPAASMEPAA